MTGQLRVWRTVGRVAVGLLVGCLLLYLAVFTAAWLLLRAPSVQQRLLPWAIEQAEKALGTRVEMERIELRVFDRVVLRRFALYDRRGVRTIAADELRIGLFSVPTLTWLTQPEGVKKILARSIELEGGYLNVYKDRETGRHNISMLFNPNPQPDDTASAEPPPLMLEIDQVRISRFAFHYADSTEADSVLAPVAGHMVYDNMLIDSVDITTSLTYLPDGTTYGEVDRLTAREAHSGLLLKRGALKARSIPATDTTEARVEVRDAALEVAGTFLSFDLDMPGQTFSTLIEEGHNRRFDARFQPSVFDWATLNYFLSEDLPMRGPVTVEGRIWGDYKSLRCRDLLLRYGEDTRLRLSARLRNYVEPDLMYMEAELAETNLNVDDVRRLLPEVQIPEAVNRLQFARIDGKFTGFWHDFVAKAAFGTRQGRIESDLRFVYDTLSGAIAYDGKLRTFDLNLDPLAGVKSAQRLNFAGEIKGRTQSDGETVAQSSFVLHDSEIYGHVIDSAHGSASIDRREIEADLVVEDAEGNFRGQLNIDLSEPRAHYRAIGEARTIDLQNYGLTALPLRVSSLLSVDLTGSSLDDLEGLASLDDLTLYNSQRPSPLRVSSLTLRIDTQPDSSKRLSVKGSAFDLEANGRFRYLPLIERATEMAKGLLRRYLPDSLPYSHPPLIAESDELDLEFTAIDVNPWLDFLHVPLNLAKGTKLSANLRFGKTDELSATVLSDSVHLSGMPLRDVAASVRLNRERRSDSLRLDVQAYAASFALSEDFVFEHPAVEIKDRYGVVYYETYYEQPRLHNRVRVAGDAVFDGQGVVTQLDEERTYFTLNDTVWRVAHAPPVNWSKGRLSVDSLRIEQGDRRLILHCSIGAKRADFIRADAKNFDLSLVEGFYPLGVKLAGKVNARFTILDPTNAFIVQAEAQIDDLSVDGVPMGQITARSRLEEGSERLAAKIGWISKNDTILRVAGYYHLDPRKEPLDFRATASRFPVQLFRPFVAEELPALEGFIDLNETRITGSFAEPRLAGRGTVDGHFTLAALGEHFIVNDQFELKGTQLLLSNFMLRNYEPKTRFVYTDRSARIDGGLTLTPQLRYSFTARQAVGLRVLRTDKDSDQPVYGTVAVERGQASIEGDLNGMRIVSPEVHLGEGTTLNFPITDYTEQQRLSYVRFVGGRETEQSANAQTPDDGFDLEFELTAYVTPKAEVNIIFDERIGDQIQVRGTGALNVSIDPDANVTLSGQYNIQEGDYLFTFANVFNRRFRITTGTLQWVDDPLDARVDLRAVYRLEQANLRAWDTLQSVSTKMDVVMNMTGSLLQPNIAFGIEAPAVTQSQSFAIAQTLRQLESDQQELNRQVFSLIVTGGVAPVGQFLGSDAASASASASMSEFLTNQLNTLIGRTVGKNIGISFGYNDRVLVMNFRASLMNNRVTIERNGAISSGGANRDITLGNLSIQYRILPTNRRENSESGQLVAELFNRENLVTGAMNMSTRGAGLFFRKEFDFIRRRRASSPVILDDTPGY